jgi:hypothetical protein
VLTLCGGQEDESADKDENLHEGRGVCLTCCSKFFVFKGGARDASGSTLNARAASW